MMLLTAMLVTNLSSALVFADDEINVTEETIENLEEKEDEDIIEDSREDSSDEPRVSDDCEGNKDDNTDATDSEDGGTGVFTEEYMDIPVHSFTNLELNAELNGYKISAVGNMPDNAELFVKEIEATEDLENKINESISNELEYHVYAAFDIDIYVDGEKWQPVDFDELVKITISGIDFSEAKESITYEPGDSITDDMEEAVYRIEDEEVTELESTLLEEEITFDTEHFTVFTVGGVSYNTNNGTCVFDTTKTYNLISNETHTPFTGTYTGYPKVKIYWFSDSKTLFWDMVDPNPDSVPVILSCYGTGLGTEGTSYAFNVTDYQAETLVFGEGFRCFSQNGFRFEDYASVRKLVFPSTLESTSSSVFKGCTALETVDMSKVTTDFLLDVSTFSDCTNLRSCVLPATTKAISHNAFFNCYNLETIGEALPPNLQSLGSFAFGHCGNLVLNTTLPSTLVNLNSFNSSSLDSDKITVTGTLPVNLRNMSDIWNNSRMHFTGLRNVTLRGDIPPYIESMGKQLFSIYTDQSIESQSYFSKNVGSYKVTAENQIPVKFIIEDREGTVDGKLLGSNEYLGFVGKEYAISDYMKKWNDPAYITYDKYAVKDNTATVTPVIDAYGTVAKAVRTWERTENYFYLKIFKNGIASELEETVTLEDRSDSHPLVITPEYIGNGIYKVPVNESEMTVSPYYYSLGIYLDGVNAKQKYNRRVFANPGDSRELKAYFCRVGYWNDSCYYYHYDGATDTYTVDLPELTNAAKMSDVELSVLTAIDYKSSENYTYINGFVTQSSGLQPIVDRTYYVDYQDYAFKVDANTGTFSDGANEKYIEFTGEDANKAFVNGAPEEPTKEGYQFAGWERSKSTNTILPSGYGAAYTSDGTLNLATNPYYGNTHDLKVADLGAHLEDKAYKHYENDLEKLCAKYRPVITLNANGGQFANGSETYTTSLTNSAYSFNYFDSPTNPTKEGHTFAGYTPNNDFIKRMSTFSVENNTPTEYTATWSINKVNIYFAQNGGTYVSSQTIDYGSKAIKPADPSKYGYTFIGWYTDSTYERAVDWENDTYKVSTTLYPLYKKSSYVTFNSNGGSAVSARYVDYGKKLEKPEDPTRNGYTFDKWYKDEGLTDEYDFDAVLEGDITLYAGWTANTYAITYNYDGGTPEVSNKTSYKPSDETFVLNSAKKTHYNFLGYTISNDDPNGFKIENPTGSPSIWKGTYGNLTVTAHYTLKPTYTVTFDLGYEGSTPFTIEVFDGDSVEKPEDPVREGYFFDYWKDATGNKVTSFEKAINGDTTYTAVWKKSYVITFDANHGTYADGTTEVELNTDSNGYVSYIPQPHRPGWRFTGGWMFDPEPGAGTKYTTTSNLSIWGKDRRLYAQYIRYIFDILYVLDGGTTESDLYTGYDGSTEVSLPDDIVKDGYYFIGWTIENDGFDGATFEVTEPGKGIVIPAETYGNLTVRAHYKKACDVTVDANGGKFADGSDEKHVTSDVDGKITLPEDPKYEGHTFIGWEIDGKEYNPDEDVITEDTVITAKWELNRVTITFMDDDEVVLSKEFKYGDHIEAPTVSKEGYTFTGWNPQYDGIAREDMVYIANWRVNTYTVKFTDYDGTVLSKKTYSYGSHIDMPKDPVRVGYKFKGFSPQIEEVCLKNAEYTAKYEIMTYTVKFVDYDGKVLSSNVYEYGDKIDIPSNPIRTGYLFSGWDKTVNNKATENVVYTAKYTEIKITYVVTFIDQTGSVIDSREYLKGETINIPEAPEKDGYEFTGWSPQVSKTCVGAAIYMATYEKKEMEPIVNTYIITFAGYNGQIISSGNYKEGETISIPNAPLLDGFNFRNWYPTVEAKATKSVTYTAVYDVKPQKIEIPTIPKPVKKKEEKKEPEEEKPVEASSENEQPDKIPEKEKFTVVFKDSDGKVISRRVYSEGDKIVVPKAPEKPGYDFEGWSPKIDGEAKKDIEYTTVYKKVEIAIVPEEPKEEKKPVKISPFVTTLVAGAACVGILTVGYFSGIWLLLLNIFFIGKRKRWKGLLTEEDNKYVKKSRHLDDDEPYIQNLYDDCLNDINTFMDAVDILKSYTVLPLGTKMFITLSDSKGTTVRDFDEADEKTFYDILVENISEDTRVVLNLVNDRCDVNIELEFVINGSHISEVKTVTDDTIEFLDEDDLPDYS